MDFHIEESEKIDFSYHNIKSITEKFIDSWYGKFMIQIVYT